MNYLYYDECLEYPKETYNYSPSVRYPEYSRDDIAGEKNVIYDSIRNIFKNVGLDSSHYGQPEWNPLGDYIRPGNCVLIKPNLVLHKNNLAGHEDSLDCLVTHPSVIRCVLDYVLIALNETGCVYIGDSPVKDCDLPLLYKRHHYDVIQEYYSEQPHIHWVDLRGPEEEKQTVDELKGILVNLGEDSYFYHYQNQAGLRIPNYDFHKVASHHSGDTQEYCVNELALRADVIINLPKPKTHRKSGYTGALKNFVGVNYSKEYLPHHTRGDKAKGGDEFYKQTLLARHASNVRAHRDILRTKSKRHGNSPLYRFWARYEGYVWRLDNKLNRKNGLDKINEGTWYRNDTLWRTVLDMNKIVHYADSEGTIHPDKQRMVLHFCDMVVSGEREGPLAPSPVEEKILLFGTNGAELDALIVRLMHFRIDMLPSIAVALKDRILENAIYENIVIHSNLAEYDNRLLKDIRFDAFKPFTAANGWHGFIEDEDKTL